VNLGGQSGEYMTRSVTDGTGARIPALELVYLDGVEPQGKEVIEGQIDTRPKPFLYRGASCCEVGVNSPLTNRSLRHVAHNLNMTPVRIRNDQYSTLVSLNRTYLTN
jgi:hypothetical protein